MVLKRFQCNTGYINFDFRHTDMIFRIIRLTFVCFSEARTLKRCILDKYLRAFNSIHCLFVVIKLYALCNFHLLHVRVCVLRIKFSDMVRHLRKSFENNSFELCGGRLFGNIFLRFCPAKHCGLEIINNYSFFYTKMK